MSETRWVQHISGKGEKWKVMDGKPSWMKDGCVVSESEWAVEHPSRSSQHLLPKSEYVLCEPPERWIDVTADCVTFANKTQIDYVTPTGPEAFHTMVCWGRDDFRLRKVQLYGEDAFNDYTKPHIRRWAFLVEKKEPE